MAVFVSALTYFGAEVIGSFIVNALAIEGLSAVTVSAIGAGTISAGVTAVKGGSIEDVFKSAVLGGVGSYVGGSIGKEIRSVVRADAIMNGNLSFDAANTIGKIAGSVGTGGLNSATQALAAGKDPIEALIRGGLTAGLSSGVSEGVNYTTSQIPGFDNLAKDYGGVGDAAQRAIKAGLTSGLLGKDVNSAVLNSVVGSVSRAGGDLVKDLTSDLRTAYNDATNTGSALDANYFQQNKIVEDYKSTAAEVEAKRQELQDNLDKYNKAKDSYDNYKGLQDPETGNYYKNVYGGIVNVPGSYNEDGTYNPPSSYKAADDQISGRVAFTEPNEFLFEANKQAKLVNETFPDFEKQRAEAEAKVTGLSTQLDELKTAATPLEKTLTDQKAVLQTNVQNFLTQEEINAQNIAKAAAEATAAQTSDTTNVATPVNTTTTEAPPTTTTETQPTTVTQTTGAAAISAQEIRDFIATHSEEEVKAAMERTGVTQAQVDAAKTAITTGESTSTTTAPVVQPPVVETPVVPVVQPPVVETPVVPVVQPPVVTPPPVVVTPVVAPPVLPPVTDPVVDPVVQPTVVTVEKPPIVLPPVTEPVVAPPVTPPVIAPVIEPSPVISPVVQPTVVPESTIVPSETPVATTLATAPRAETAADLQKVFLTVAEKPVLPTGGLETIASNLQNPIAMPTTANPATETSGGLNAVSGNFVDTGADLQLPDLSKTFGSMATKFLQSKLSPSKRPTTARKPSSVPRLAATPVGGLSAVKAPVKAAAAPRVDVSKLIPVQKAATPPKTMPSNAKLTPVQKIANLTSLVKKVG